MLEKQRDEQKENFKKQNNRVVFFIIAMYAGIISCIGGLITTAFGLVNLFLDEGFMGEQGSLKWMLFLGIGLLVLAICLFVFLAKKSRQIKAENAAAIKAATDKFANAQKSTNATSFGAVQSKGQMSKVCANCGRENPSDSVFCNSCGDALSVSCPVCGNEAEPDARFCKNCGGRL